MIPLFFSRPIAARILGVSETRLIELVAAGHLPRHGGAQPRFMTADLAKLRGRPVTEADLAFAEAAHSGRLASYSRQNQKRQANAAHA